MPRHLAAVLATVYFLSGCAALRFGPEDSLGTKVTKGVLRVPQAILTLGISEASYAVDRKMESWLGQYSTDLMMAWGPPSQVIPDRGGGEMLVYTNTTTYVSPGYSTTTTTGSATAYSYGNTAQAYGTAQSQTTYVPPQVHQSTTYRIFRLDSTGRIVSYSWRGL